MSEVIEKETKISKAEAAELRRIVKGRFDLLRESIGHRENEIRSTIREQIEAESAADIKAAKKKIDALKKKARAFEDEAKRIKEEIEATGVQVGDSWRVQRGYEVDIVSVDVEDTISVKKIDERVDREFKKLASERGRLSVSLRSEELDLLEQLSVGQLNGPAKDFLASVPTLDKLLPMPNSSKELGK